MNDCKSHGNWLNIWWKHFSNLFYGLNYKNMIKLTFDSNIIIPLKSMESFF